MPIVPPALDDRGFDDLVDELISRIPAHTQEWTNPRVGDPGRTLVELFAWLTSTLLYRANLIPERQRLVFLKLLGQQMRPAIAASGLVCLSFSDDATTMSASLVRGATISGPRGFETTREITVLPVTGEAYYKRKLVDTAELPAPELLEGLQYIYNINGPVTAYATTPIFVGGAPVAGGLDILGSSGSSVDGSLWVALLAAKPELVPAIRHTLGGSATGDRQILNVGITPTIQPADPYADIGPTARVPVVWQMSTGQEIGTPPQPEYRTLDLADDSTNGLTTRGVVRLLLPQGSAIGALSNDVRTSTNAGVGDRPPRLDDPQKDARLVTWLRLRPTDTLHTLQLSWLGINAVEIDQRQTLTGRVLGASTGAIDQQFALPGQSVEPDTLVLQVEEAGRGYQPWQRVDDLALYGRDDGVFTLDSEAGTVQFGNGVRGRVPDVGLRIRVATMRSGGGVAGNLPANALTGISGAHDTSGMVVASGSLRVLQTLPTDGGADSETLSDAEQRIPALFHHQDRAVTADDYRALAAATPGVHLGRVDVLPFFKPQQRRSPVPGVVSVMVLPYQSQIQPPNPRADRHLLEAVYAYLDARRPLSTEMYVIGCDYKPLGVSVGVTIHDGFGRDSVLSAVGDALRAYLWPLPPGGPDSAGWPRGRTVRDRELEVVVARVPGVSTVYQPIRLFTRVDKANAGWSTPVSEVSLDPWQLPELLSVMVVADMNAPTNLTALPNPFADPAAVAVPVVPKVC